MRYPAVAGQFYSGTKEGLTKELERCFLHPLGPGKLPVLKKGPRTIKGAVCPHAGYMYSGPVAAHVYSKLAEDGFPETFIILGPNHSGMGSGIATTIQTFNTPLGNVPVDVELAKKITKDIIDDDIISHRYEHSIEVQLPFLQYIKPNIKFVPICVGIQDYKAAKDIGGIISETTRGKDVVVIASTDFSHYVPINIAKTKDKMAIDQILVNNPKELYNVVMKQDISMCGYGPVMAMLCSVGDAKGELLKYATSGDVHAMDDVVGYGAIIMRQI